MQEWAWKGDIGLHIDRYILIKEASEALVVEGGGGRGELDREPGIGGVEEGLIRRGGAGEEELGCAEGGERLS